MTVNNFNVLSGSTLMIDSGVLQIVVRDKWIWIVHRKIIVLSMLFGGG